MPVPSKIQDTEKLRKCYIDERMSPREIASRSIELFGFAVGASAIRNSLINAGISQRSKGDAVSVAKSTLDPAVSHMSEEILEWVDGFLLGDGAITFGNKSILRGARFSMQSSEIEWTNYAICKFLPYAPSETKQEGQISQRRPNPLWHSRTLTHPDIVAQAQRWYPAGKKAVPADVRITSTSVRLWYLGDGSFTYMPKTNSSNLRLATPSFTEADVNGILLPKLATLGIHGERDAKGDIRIATKDTFRFFDLIGWESPIACYAHKFDVPEWLGLNRLADIVQSKQELWLADSWMDAGKVAFTRSPRGRLRLLDDGQAARLRELLNQHRAKQSAGAADEVVG
jgi:hypothetical protein